MQFMFECLEGSDRVGVEVDRSSGAVLRLCEVNGATVDLNNVDGYHGLKLPLRVIANEDARREFFSVCSWIKEALEVQA